MHASLKRWCAEEGDRVEVPVDGFVVDLVRGDLLIEVQTRGFSSMKRKLTTLLELGHRIRVVHPIPEQKWIVKVNDDGAEIDRRRSPKRGSRYDLFAELVSFPELVRHPALEIEVLLTHQEEIRYHDPSKAWRRKGWVVRERRLVEVVGDLVVKDASDLADLIPATLPQPFTTADLAAETGVPRRLAQQMAYCLRAIEVIAPDGKRGNAVLYRAG